MNKNAQVLEANKDYEKLSDEKKFDLQQLLIKNLRLTRLSPTNSLSESFLEYPFSYFQKSWSSNLSYKHEEAFGHTILKCNEKEDGSLGRLEEDGHRKIAMLEALCSREGSASITEELGIKIVFQDLTSSCPSSASAPTPSAPMVAMPSRMVTPSVSLTLVVTETYKGKALLQHPSRSNVDVTYSREDEEHVHQPKIGAVDYPAQLLHGLGIVQKSAPVAGCRGAKGSSYRQYHH